MPVKVYERILQLFEAEGIKTIFGIPDPSFFHMFATADARGWRVIAPHHEEAGGFMADAMARMTGKPGVVVGNQGPGVANLVPAIICAVTTSRMSWAGKHTTPGAADSTPSSKIIAPNDCRSRFALSQPNVKRSAGMRA